MASQRLKMKNQTVVVPHKRIKRFDDNGSGTTSTDHLYLNLDHDVVENIFSFLPIKKAVTLSPLSTRFKNSWRLSRNLCFDFDFARLRSRAEFMTIVNHVLNSHTGSKIQRFRLYFDPANVGTLVEYWIKMVTSKDVEELDLDFTEARDPLKLSYDLLDVESIRVLKLAYCVIDLPPKLKGLCLLKTIVLEQVDADPILIKTLLSNCLLLEFLNLVQCSKIFDLNVFGVNLRRFKVLTVRNCYDISMINIDAPTLRAFHYKGVVHNINFYSPMPKLNDVTINFDARGFPMVFQISDLLIGFSTVAVLTVSSTFLEGVSQRYEDGNLKQPQMYLYNVREIHLWIEKSSYINPYDIASLLKNSPHLERIFIDFGEFSFEPRLYWELHGKKKFGMCTPFFESVRFIKLVDFKLGSLELEMMKFFLKKASLGFFRGNGLFSGWNLPLRKKTSPWIPATCPHFLKLLSLEMGNEVPSRYHLLGPARPCSDFGPRYPLKFRVGTQDKKRKMSDVPSAGGNLEK
ncbi:putative FBD-associated F-box protein At1g61330 [Cornus florida]|uniref:putative FBD-associated F-box protein At1g61330 n=1 Tax=Cornus florida TaxID=4283 RepID=UPI0028966163|nr:putative FBD-associated F-box protein At1g61330 [Cornus florida]